jgi:glycosyltransferase involved in cell wall biosynthesis
MKVSVSVAMTTYNGIKYIEEQLDSILKQTLRPAEIIVCDDGSNDGTIETLQRYAAAGAIQLHVNKVQLGVIENFKKAVSLCAAGNFIALADQDDVWEVDKLRIQAEMLTNLNTEARPAIVYSDLKLVDDQLQLISPSFMLNLDIRPERETIKSLLFGNFITGCTIMLNPAMRAHFLRIPAQAHMHDAWLAMVAFTLGQSAYIPLQLIKYRQHGRNVTFDTNKKVSAAEKIQKIISGLFRKNDFLLNYIQNAELFLNTYKLELSDTHKKIFLDFLNYRDKPFFVKKIASIKARKYRYTL